MLPSEKELEYVLHNIAFISDTVESARYHFVRGKNDVVMKRRSTPSFLFSSILFESTRAFIGSQQQRRERKREMKSRRTQRIE